MSFRSSIPVVTDALMKSQSQIRANFIAISQAFSDNHVGLTATENRGKHNVMVFRPVSDPATTATQVALYNKLVMSVPQLFYRPNSSQTPIQMTFDSIQTGIQTAGPPVVYFQDQYTFVAGPFVIYGGKVVNPTQGQTKTLVPTTTLLYVDLIVANTNRAAGVANAVPTNIVGSSFDISFPALVGAETQDVYYFAIGKP